MIVTIGTVTSATGQSVQTVGELTPEKRPKAIRLILASIADNPVRQLDWWLKTARPKLLEPRNERTGACRNYFSHSLQL
jgi:hypothetical protein